MIWENKLVIDCRDSSWGSNRNREILKNIRFKLDKVIKEFNGDINKDNPESYPLVNIRDYSMCLDPKLRKSKNQSIKDKSCV